MSLQFLVNSAWQNAVQLGAFNNAGTEMAQTNLENVTGGQRWQFWESATTDDLQVRYINRAATLSCSHVVITRADRIAGHQLYLGYWGAYTGSSTNPYDSGTNFAGPYVGRTGRDFIYAMTQTGKQAFGAHFLGGVGGAYTKRISQIYFSNAFTFSYPGPAQKRPLPFPSRYIVGRQAYLVDDEWTLIFDGVSRADVLTFESLYNLRTEPLFIYDSAGTLIDFNLLHCIIQDVQITAIQDDSHVVEVTALSLRTWQ